MIKESCKLYERYANTPSMTAQKLYYYPQFVGRFICNPDFYIERRDYSSILLLYALRGNGHLSYRDNEYLLSAGHFALINCKDTHVYFPDVGEEWDFYFLHFNRINCFEMYEYIYSLNERAVFKGDERIKSYIEGCIHACRTKAPGYEALASKLLYDIAHSCIIQNRSGTQKEVSAACEYIAEHCNKDLSTELLSKKFGFSRSYFSTQFKRSTGTTLHEYLICCRLDRAKLLLLENSLSVEQIAQRTGFNDVGTFIRAFKRKEKLTPAQYRKSFSCGGKQT